MKGRVPAFLHQGSRRAERIADLCGFRDQRQNVILRSTGLRFMIPVAFAGDVALFHGRSLVVKEIVILTQGGKGERRIGDNKYQKGITEITGGRTPPNIYQQNDYFSSSSFIAAMLKPPSTWTTSPEIPAERSEHRNAAELPTSSIVTVRRIGVTASQ